jgi:hypothetical protein
MKKIIIAIIVITIGVLWYSMKKKLTDEEAIKYQLYNLSAICSKKEKEPATVASIKKTQLQRIIAKSCSVSINQSLINGNYKTVELASIIIKSEKMFLKIFTEIDDIQIKLNSDKESAIIKYSVRIYGKTKKGNSFDDNMYLISEIKKENDIWKFSSFKIQKVLNK